MGLFKRNTNSKVEKYSRRMIQEARKILFDPEYIQATLDFNDENKIDSINANALNSEIKYVCVAIILAVLSRKPKHKNREELEEHFMSYENKYLISHDAYDGLISSKEFEKMRGKVKVYLDIYFDYVENSESGVLAQLGMGMQLDKQQVHYGAVEAIIDRLIAEVFGDKKISQAKKTIQARVRREFGITTAQIDRNELRHEFIGPGTVVAIRDFDEFATKRALL